MQRDLNDLFYFAQVVDHRGFAPAARALGLPKSKLSRRVALLEERLGVRLIQRSTRRFSVTDIGQRYYAHCKAMLVEADAAQDAIEMTHSEPCGVVRITCPVALLHARVAEMLAAFLIEHPRVTLHLEETNRRVDVIAEGIDVAIRARMPPLEDSDLIVKVLGKRRWGLVASPSLLHRHPAPKVPADLNTLPTLDQGPPPPEHVWQLEGPEGATAAVRHTPRLVTDDMTTLRCAAVAGVGIASLPTMMVGNELRAGALLPVLPGWAPQCGVIHAVFPSRRGLLPAVRRLIDFLAERFARIDEA